MTRTSFINGVALTLLFIVRPGLVRGQASAPPQESSKNPAAEKTLREEAERLTRMLEEEKVALHRLARDQAEIQEALRRREEIPRARPGVGGALVFGGLPSAQTTNFEPTQSDVGKLPAGWNVAHTGTGEGSVWKVVADDTAPSKSGYVLAQTAESPSKFFNLCVADKPSVRDIALCVGFKAVKGKEDQGGGLVWRYQDADNYYIARMNPLEDNFRVYKVIAGKRIQLGTKEGLKVPAGEWHTLSIKQVGDKIECSLDGTKYLEAIDTAITAAGKVGLWTKADAQTHFDGLRVTDLGR
jgi:hypothetical protein